MQKTAVISAILTHLEAELATAVQAARAAHEAATHDESRAEDAHDTRGIEASYLAGAQAQRAAELEAQLAAVRQFPARDAEAGTSIAPGALVELESVGRASWAFVVERGGGLQLQVEGASVRVISPQSPLGEELVGRRAGDEIELESKGTTRSYLIQSVR